MNNFINQLDLVTIFISLSVVTTLLVYIAIALYLINIIVTICNAEDILETNIDKKIDINK